MDGLANKEVKVVNIPRHIYTGTVVEAEKKAIDEAKSIQVGKAMNQRYYTMIIMVVSLTIQLVEKVSINL
ncbi:MAG: hypothetical protein PHU66_08820 [Bacteroidaceae bacterium]|nr:hypothetical protein [Bacteroidaceae bacterium]